MLDAAAAQFRVRGFADTSTEQLCAAAGVRRSSLYNAFDSKDELFVRALERYVEVTGESQEAVLADAELDGFARVSGVLNLMIAEEHEASTEGHAAGCMVVTTTRMTPDRGSQDPRVARILDRALGRQLAMLEHAVRARQARRQPPAGPGPSGHRTAGRHPDLRDSRHGTGRLRTRGTAADRRTRPQCPDTLIRHY